MKGRTQTCGSVRAAVWAAVVVGWGVLGAGLCSAECVQNCILDIIWQARLKGTVGTQSFDQNVQPVMVTRKLTETTLLTAALGRPPSAEEVLAVRFRLETGGATVSLVVFNVRARTIVTSITFDDPVVLFLDGRGGVFAVRAEVPFTSTTLQGGVLTMAGAVRQARNVPSRVKAVVQGTLVAPASVTPPFGPSLTGLVMKGSLRTVGAPLRVEPPIIPQPLFFP
jgi:hypothetical protein